MAFYWQLQRNLFTIKKKKFRLLACLYLENSASGLQSGKKTFKSGEKMLPLTPFMSQKKENEQAGHL